MEVQIKDREDAIEYLRMALAMAEFGVSYEQADLINRVVNEVRKKKGKFAIDDGLKLFSDWKRVWERYYENLIKEKQNGKTETTDGN
jgi:hypothetical protein